MPVATLRRAAPQAAGLPGRRPHICFVAPYLWPVLAGDRALKVVGGAEVQQCLLARLFAAHGYRVSVVSFDYGQPDGALVDGVRVRKAFHPEAGIPVLRFVHPRLTTMWRVMREVDADVYYQRSSAVWTGIVAQFCRWHGKRSIYAGASDRDFEIGAEQIQFARDRWLYRRGLQLADRIVVQNAFQLASCRRNHRREAVLIPSTYQPPPAARRATLANDLVLWVGTVHEHKRAEWLLELAERLPARRFALIGGPSVGAGRDGEYYDSVRRRAATLPNVRFLGFLPLAEVETWFDRARLLVSTSLYEGMPNVFLQAWARGVPTLSTVDVGAPVSRVFDDPAQGAEKLEALFRDPALWTRASAESLQYFQHNHSTSEVLARYARLMDELAA